MKAKIRVLLHRGFRLAISVINRWPWLRQLLIQLLNMNPRLRGLVVRLLRGPGSAPGKVVSTTAYSSQHSPAVNNIFKSIQVQAGRSAGEHK